MNKEELKKRLIFIEEHIKKTNQEIQKNYANLNILEGGKQECLYWLKTMEIEVSEVSEESIIKANF